MGKLARWRFRRDRLHREASPAKSRHAEADEAGSPVGTNRTAAPMTAIPPASSYPAESLRSSEVKSATLSARRRSRVAGACAFLHARTKSATEDEHERDDKRPGVHRRQVRERPAARERAEQARAVTQNALRRWSGPGCERPCLTSQSTAIADPAGAREAAQPQTEEPPAEDGERDTEHDRTSAIGAEAIVRHHDETKDTEEEEAGGAEPSPASTAPARSGTRRRVSSWSPIPQYREFWAGPNGLIACHAGCVTIVAA